MERDRRPGPLSGRSPARPGGDRGRPRRSRAAGLVRRHRPRRHRLHHGLIPQQCRFAADVSSRRPVTGRDVGRLRGAAVDPVGCRRRRARVRGRRRRTEAADGNTVGPAVAAVSSPAAMQALSHTAPDCRSTPRSQPPPAAPPRPARPASTERPSGWRGCSRGRSRIVCVNQRLHVVAPALTAAERVLGECAGVGQRLALLHPAALVAGFGGDRRSASRTPPRAGPPQPPRLRPESSTGDGLRGSHEAVCESWQGSSVASNQGARRLEPTRPGALQRAPIRDHPPTVNGGAA